MTTPAGNNYQYIYDEEGHRVTTVSRTDANCAPLANGDYVLADYVNDQYGRQITRVNSSEQWQHVNVFANGELLATYEASDGGLHFALNDWLGDKRIQASPQGSTQYTIDLTCWNLPFNSHFGCSSNTNGTDATEHHYTGKEHDPYTGLDLFGARDYANYSGRFLSPDWSKNPQGVPYADFSNPQSLNLYSYLRNNPLSGTDPDGHCGGAPAGTTSVWFCILNFLGLNETAQQQATRIAGERNALLGGMNADGSPLTDAQKTRIQRSNSTQIDALYQSALSNSMTAAMAASKPVNLPAWKNVDVDMDHIESGHMGGERAIQSEAAGAGKDQFPPGMSKEQVESAIREAYKNGSLAGRQGDVAKVIGNGGGMQIEMYVNTATKTIETAYPKW